MKIIITENEPLLKGDYKADFEDKSSDALKRQEEIKKTKSEFYLLLYRSLKPLYFFGLAFLFMLFFIILPLSEMNFYDENNVRILENELQVFQEWARTFLQTSTFALIGLATLIVSDILKRLFEFSKKQVEKQ